MTKKPTYVECNRGGTGECEHCLEIHRDAENHLWVEAESWNFCSVKCAEEYGFDMADHDFDMSLLERVRM